MSLNNEIGTPVLSVSKKGSTRSNKKNSQKSIKQLDLEEKGSETSIQDIQIIPLIRSPSITTPPSQVKSSKPDILSNDISDIYRVINSDIQYKKSKRPSGVHLESNKSPPSPEIMIENNNLEKNKKEYMKKIETKRSNKKFEQNLKQLDFTKDLERDDDMQKMKNHVKKLQEIRIEKQISGVDSSKEIVKGSQKKENKLKSKK